MSAGGKSPLRQAGRAVRRMLEALMEKQLRWFLGRRVVIPPRPPAPSDEETLGRTADLNAAAEQYYAEYPKPEFLLGKPFTDVLHFPQYLFNLGVLFHGLRVSPGDVVLELGAGSCWVSHFLNLYGCPTVAVDVSESGLELGRELFRRDSATRWELEPRFLVYDGHHLPLPDASCDRVVIHDAFHHVPNPDAILQELVRVLRPGGIVAMCEPGRGHSATEDSQREMAETGVLEKDVELDELADAAERAGFTDVNLMPVTLPGIQQIPARHAFEFVRGRGFFDYWPTWASHLVTHYYLVLYKGRHVPNTRRPGYLAARIEPLGVPSSGLATRAGQSAGFRCRVTNTGDTRWLTGAGGVLGWTRLGVHLYAAGQERAIDLDWHREDLPVEVEPGETLAFEVTLPGLETPGDYRLVLDLVAEEVTWFAQRGSPAVELKLRVEG